MSKTEFFSVCRYVAYREFNGEFLIFSGFTRDTLIVHPYAFRIVQFVEKKSRSFQDILNFIHEIDYELKNGWFLVGGSQKNDIVVFQLLNYIEGWLFVNNMLS